VAAKGYFDALVKLGELASDSQGSKDLGKTLQIQTQGKYQKDLSQCPQS